MRFIGTLSNQSEAEKIVSFLKAKGIESHCEPSFETATGFITYHLWVIDEDQLREANDCFLRFQTSPTNPEFDVKVAVESVVESKPPGEIAEQEEVRAKASTPLTFILLGLCVFLFLWSTLEEVSMDQRGFLGRPFAMTSLQADLMYDLPPPFEKFQETFQKLSPTQTFDSLPSDTKTQIEHPSVPPFWQGIYDWILLKIKHQDVTPIEGPLFIKVKQGEFWRLFSPCFLHAGFFHILFNMLWLWILGRSIEAKIGVLRTLILTAVTAVGGNTAQYFISGPLFLGYSGIIMGLAAFIWIREKIAPWEGYTLNRSTLYFLFLFIGAIFVLSFVSFFIQLFTESPISPSIANTAHIGGGLLGVLLAKSKFFAARVRK